ncbi:hypothetical protein JCM1393_07550 [Clostridium carnis]
MIEDKLILILNSYLNQANEIFAKTTKEILEINKKIDNITILLNEIKNKENIDESLKGTNESANKDVSYVKVNKKVDSSKGNTISSNNYEEVLFEEQIDLSSGNNIEVNMEVDMEK